MTSHPQIRTILAVPSARVQIVDRSSNPSSHAAFAGVESPYDYQPSVDENDHSTAPQSAPPQRHSPALRPTRSRVESRQDIGRCAPRPLHWTKLARSAPPPSPVL